MKCTVYADPKVVIGSIEIDAAGVTTEETPEILLYIANGWVTRTPPKSKPEVVATESEPAVVADPEAKAKNKGAGK